MAKIFAIAVVVLLAGGAFLTDQSAPAQDPVAKSLASDFSGKFLIVSYRQSSQTVDALLSRVEVKTVGHRTFIVGEYASPDAQASTSVYNKVKACIPEEGIEVIHVFNDLKNAEKLVKSVQRPQNGK